jgi:hypothetical protein
LITGRSDGGNVSPIVGFTYFSEDDRIPTQNFLVALIDVASGRLTSVPQKFSDTTAHEEFDDASDDACTLPDWNSVLHYTTAAHQACCNFVFVGWDVAFTLQGPMLLEGNVNWCADEYQRLRGEPLGHTKFADILEGKLVALDVTL